MTNNIEGTHELTTNTLTIAIYRDHMFVRFYANEYKHKSQPHVYTLQMT